MSEQQEPILLSEADLDFAKEVAAQPGGENIWRCFRLRHVRRRMSHERSRPGIQPPQDRPPDSFWAALRGAVLAGDLVLLGVLPLLRPLSPKS